MSDIPDPDYTQTERYVLLAWWLAEGERLTTEQVARRLHVQRNTAQRMFTRMSRKLPIYRDMRGRWRKVIKTRENP